jgi:hypothetical protein
MARHASTCANPHDDSHARCRQRIPVIAQAPLNPPTRPCRICGHHPCDPAAHVFADAEGPSAPRTYDELIAATRRAVAGFERNAS